LTEALLVKSNLSSDPTKRLDDQELLENCSTFLSAGADSVAMAISWALYFLSLDTAVQHRLRQELASTFSTSSDDMRVYSPSGTPQIAIVPTFTTFSSESWDLLNSLPLLDAVVRESLRFCPPVHATIRVATKDDQIPISRPIQLRDGTSLQPGDHITIRKGSHIQIPIEGLNYHEELWGPSARSFK
jgi:cytochrome P450